MTKRLVACTAICIAAVCCFATTVLAVSPLDAWRSNVSVRDVSEVTERHTIHSYYLTSPESPDGSRILLFASSTPDGQRGDLGVRDRATGKETIVARNIETEDAHRAACQQWISGGRRIAYHDVQDGQWSVHVVDLETGNDVRLLVDRQLGFGREVDELLPVYGCHWNPGGHRDLELLNAVTGEVQTAISITDVEQRHGDWMQKQFSGRPTSIFFPHISPDGTRVFFKMAAPGRDGPANKFRSKNASDRQGLFVYELGTKRFLYHRASWGHPAWMPDSRSIVEIGYTLIDSDTGNITRLNNLPPMGSGHPSASPDGKLIVTDLPAEQIGGVRGEWAVVLCDVRGGDHVVLHRFENSGGARSWRKNHPHPIFSADGRRIYFNVNSGDWTRLYVAERQN